MKRKAFWIATAIFWIYWAGVAFAVLPQVVLTGSGTNQVANWGMGDLTVCNDGSSTGYIDCDAVATTSGFKIIAARCIRIHTRSCGQINYIGSGATFSVINAQ